MRRAAWKAAALFASASLGMACGAEEQPEMQAPPVTVAPVQIRNVVDEITATGELIARNQAKIAAEVSGRITHVALDEGASAEEGTIVLEIDTERRQLDLASTHAALAEARAALKEQKRELARTLKLHGRAVASDARLDQVRTALSTARSRVAAAEARAALGERAVRDSTVVAPFSGRLGERYVSVGEFVSVGTPLFELVALDPIEAEFHVAEIDSSRVVLGQEVEVEVSPYPDELFAGPVIIVSPTINPRTRTLRIRASLENPEGRLRPGLFARVTLGVAHRKGVLMVPEEAILRRADGAVIFRVSDKGVVSRGRVELGAHELGEVEVRYGVGPEDRVVTRGHADLIDGAAVSVRNPDGSITVPAVASGPPDVRTEARP